MICFISAAAIVPCKTHALVVISRDGWNASFSYFIDHFIRPNVIANKVSQAIDSIELPAVHVNKARLQSWKVCMNVAKECNFHFVSFRLTSCLAAAATTRFATTLLSCDKLL